ncbi:DUF2573 family protein [Bacillus aquiflavi]|uniref:DUF2573 family protein n=1 Tax=Bacillus aquiflavi TaxID=2672567 RepID=A0A6B3W129_9BACI|nr:DUF2573 family protein [Bacillus aquiflavi]MBA4536939.1 DUF2573 family protein [Bacillus aquiflavi]NEY82325.1 DUF2573 family protein [Bacillus aquiflavi]UAC47756.1 YusU family protein [Bacillus aquiflavi]
MDQKFSDQFAALIEKYTELLLGDKNDELIEKVKIWVLYTYMAKSMPPLVKHWNEQYPEGKEAMKKLISEIKELNDIHRAKIK